MFVIDFTDFQQAVLWNFFIISAIVACYVLQWSEGKRLRIDLRTWSVFLSLVYFSMIIGTRLGALSFQELYALLLHGTIPGYSGSTILGGVFLTIPVVIIFALVYRLPGRVFDAFLLPLLLGASLGRVACLGSGCCFGILSGHFPGVQYTANTPAYQWQAANELISSDAAHSLAVHPAPLYFIVFNGLAFVVLWSLRKRIRIPGIMASLVLVCLYGNRFLIEFFREAITNRGMMGEHIYGLKVAQWICLLLFVMGVFSLIYLKSRDQKVKVQALGIPSGTLSITLVLAYLICLFCVQNIIGFEMEIVLLLSSIPVLMGALKYLPDVLAQSNTGIFRTSLASALALGFLIIPMDSIPVQGDKASWIDIRAGGTMGSFSDVSRNCEGSITNQDDVNMKTASLDVSYNRGLTENNFGIGLRGNIGSLGSVDPSHDYNLGTIGMYSRLNYKKIGLSIGALYTRRKYQSGNLGGITENKIYVPFLIRYGRTEKFYVDISYLENHAFSIYPEPSGSFGLNWGFGDSQGLNTMRLSAMIINEEFGFGISGSRRIAKLPLSVEGGFYLQQKPFVSFGLQYRVH